MHSSPWRCSDHDESHIPSKERSPLLWETFSSSYNGTVWLTPSTNINYDSLDYTAYTAPGVIVLDEDVF